MSHTFNYAGFFSTWHESDKKYSVSEDVPPTTVEVTLSDGKTATFYRESGEVLLESEETAFFLDRTETYRLFSLLEAEFKGMVS